MIANTPYPPIKAVTLGPLHHFFGYYDKSPWDATGQYMLTLQSTFIDRPPIPDDGATVGLIDLENGLQLTPLVRTRAWNWQQGTMLQWLPSAPDRLIICNDRRDGRFLSVIYDIHTGEERVLPLPIYTLSHDGLSALTLNFARLAHTRPGYGYVGLTDPWAGEAAPGEDGIYWMNLVTGEYRLVVSLAQIVGVRPRPDMQGAIHWFNHLLFSPDDRRFIFLHRWSSNPGEWWTTRMLTANCDGSNICLLADYGFVSHFDWRDPNHVLAWARHPGWFGWHGPRLFLRWLRHRRVGDAYFRFKDQTQHTKIVGRNLLPTDGHCSYSPDRRWILTDTYPDAENKRTLILFHEAEERRVDLGRFYSPPELHGEFRCDLHPRWSRDGRQVCIDSVHEGDRQMYIIDVADIVGETVTAQ